MKDEEKASRSRKLVLKKQLLRNLTDIELGAIAAASEPHGVPPDPAPGPGKRIHVML